MPAKADMGTKEYLNLCHSNEQWQQVACLTYATAVRDAYSAIAITSMRDVVGRLNQQKGTCVRNTT
jgi:hypothetical protein